MRASGGSLVSSLSHVISTHPTPLPHDIAQPTHPARQTRLPSSRAMIAAAPPLFCSVGLAACGGGGGVSDAVPKSTPEISPPTDTSAEKAAVQTTSTSTTSTAKSSEGSTGASSEEATASEEDLVERRQRKRRLRKQRSHRGRRLQRNYEKRRRGTDESRQRIRRHSQRRRQRPRRLGRRWHGARRRPRSLVCRAHVAHCVLASLGQRRPRFFQTSRPASRCRSGAR